MRFRILFVFLMLVVAVNVRAQLSPPTAQIKWSAVTPASCNPNSRSQAFLYNWVSGTLYQCSGGTYAAFGGGGLTMGDTITSATQGSVFFAGASGALAQDNTNFNWDATNTQLNLGAGGATKTPLLLQLASAQSADAFQVKDSGGNPIFRVVSDGRIRLGNGYVNNGITIYYGASPAIATNMGNGSAFSILNDKQLAWTTGVEAAADSTGIMPYSAGVLKVTSGATNTVRALQGGGTSVASASAMPLPTGRVFHVTGTTNITSITSTNFQSGVCITLIFDDVLTFTDGSNLKLAGNFVTTADDTISLCYDGTNWYETSRSVN